MCTSNRARAIIYLQAAFEDLKDQLIKIRENTKELKNNSDEKESELNKRQQLIEELERN